MPQDDSQTPYGLSLYDNVQSSLQNIQITFERLKLVFKTKTFARQPFHAHNTYASTIQIADNINYEIVIQLSKVSDRFLLYLYKNRQSKLSTIEINLPTLLAYFYFHCPNTCLKYFVLIILYLLHDLLLKVSQICIEYITNSMGFMNTFNLAHTL